MHILLSVLFGRVLGFIVPGHEPGRLGFISMLIGVGGAIVGGYFGRVLGAYREGRRRDRTASRTSGMPARAPPF